MFFYVFNLPQIKNTIFVSYINVWFYLIYQIQTGFARLSRKKSMRKIIPYNLQNQPHKKNKLFHQRQLSSQTKIIAYVNNLVCQICCTQQQTQEMVKVCLNNHIFCIQCINSHVKAKMQANEKLLCCMVGCGQEIISEYNNQDQELQQKNKQFYTNQVNLHTKDGKYNLYIVKTEQSMQKRIKQYKQQYKKLLQKCPKCKFSSTKNILAAKYITEKCKQCIQKQLILPQNFKLCPSCSKPIQKQKGCDHIRCICGHQFCFTCSQKWSKSHICKYKIPKRQGFSFFLFFILKLFVYLIISIPILVIFVLFFVFISLLSSIMFGLYAYFKLIQELIKYKNINQCFKVILFLLGLILFAVFIGICLLPGFFVPIINMFVEEDKRIMYNSNILYQLGQTMSGCIRTVQLI